MIKKIIILFGSNLKNLSLNKKNIEKLNKNFSKIILFKKKSDFVSKPNSLLKKKLENIQKKYNSIKIQLNYEKISKIDLFLRSVKLKHKKEKIFVAPFFISGLITEEEFIFNELSKLYGIKFLRPELSFIKNRYILSKNLFKHFYELKKKTQFDNTKYNKLKKNYILSLKPFSNLIVRKKKINSYTEKIFFLLIKTIFKFKINKTTKKYALVIMGNDMNLNLLAENLNLSKFVSYFLKTFNYDLVFLFHPNTNLVKLLSLYIRDKNYFFKSQRIVFIKRSSNLNELIQNSKFIVHLTSSLSAQTLFFKKQILCLGKNIMYLNFFNNLVSRFNKHNFQFLNKKINKNDLFQADGFLKKIVSNSVDINGNFNLRTDKHYYSSRPKISEKKIIINLLSTS